MRIFVSLICLIGLLTVGTAVSSQADDTDCPVLDETYTPAEVQGVDVADCSLVGETVSSDGIDLSVPDPGEGVTMELIGETEADNASLALDVDIDGTLSVSGSLVDDADPIDVDPRAVSECDQGAYGLANERWASTSDWYINRDSIPSGDVDADNAVSAIRRGIQNITGGQSPCDSEGAISASASYQGDSSRTPDISGMTCAPRADTDGKSVVAFGNLPSNYWAGTCTWSKLLHTQDAYKTISEADMKLNKNDKNFRAQGACDHEGDLENITTHEFGHWFGLADLYDRGAQLTMYAYISNCETKKRSLGKGDLIGLNEYY